MRSLPAQFQVGVFPFDHKEHLDPNTTAAYMEVWLQQVQTRFSELPHIQEQIAKEVRYWVLSRVFSLPG